METETEEEKDKEKEETIKFKLFGITDDLGVIFLVLLILAIAIFAIVA